MRVLAVDPGERIGWCTADVSPALTATTTRPAELAQLHVVDHGISYLKDMALAVHLGVVVEGKYDVVVCESWRLSAKGARVSIGSDMPSSQFVGMVRLCCWVAGVPFVEQGPAAMSTARRTFDNHPSGAAIRDIIATLPAAHDERHNESALLHLWFYFRERYV